MLVVSSRLLRVIVSLLVFLSIDEKAAYLAINHVYVYEKVYSIELELQPKNECAQQTRHPAYEMNCSCWIGIGSNPDVH